MLLPFVLAFVAWLPGAFSLPQLGERFHAEDSNATLEARQGYFWSYWSEGNGNWRCNNGAGGSYTATWSGNNGGFVCGKGWNPGGSRSVKYTGTYEPKGPGYLALYGWTTNPLIEYYIMDSHGDLAPNEPWTAKGNFTIAGEGTYAVYTSTRVNKPSIVGTATFQQYWSVRTETRVGGTITTSKHFDAWRSFGMNLGGHNYMILATEGYTNGANTPSGSSSLTLG
ncbi:putative endo- -beta-xylanase B [Rosellinia necatrix]|uniref:Endo-1,4-beta-xylanase n=1 Tax=Rosellinia necatrix TaxID=77044 RepID=A0A1S7UKB7_ROSNE|nr:putative endo- -beta-xylanase B [Rosellinia necatrix]